MNVVSPRHSSPRHSGWYSSEHWSQRKQLVCVSVILQTQYNCKFSVFLTAFRLLLVPFAVGKGLISLPSRHLVIRNSKKQHIYP